MLSPMRDARSKPIQFKIFNRLYWTPVRMNRLGLSESNLCWRCKTDKGDLLHMFLYCPNLTAYWQRVTEKIIDSLGTNINLTPALCLLNSMKGNKRINEKKSIVAKGSTHHF